MRAQDSEHGALPPIFVPECAALRSVGEPLNGVLLVPDSKDDEIVLIKVVGDDKALSVGVCFDELLAAVESLKAKKEDR